jgi:hypothetical protein
MQRETEGLDSSVYWKNLYLRGGISGYGSYGKLLQVEDYTGVDVSEVVISRHLNTYNSRNDKAFYTSILPQRKRCRLRL